MHNAARRSGRVNLRSEASRNAGEIEHLPLIAVVPATVEGKEVAYFLDHNREPHMLLDFITKTVVALATFFVGNKSTLNRPRYTKRRKTAGPSEALVFGD